MLITAYKLRYQLTGPQIAFGDKRQEISDKIIALVKENRMVPWYRDVWVSELGQDADTIPSSELESMQEQNEREIGEIDAKITDAEEELGEDDTRSLWEAKIDLFARIGDKENTVYWIKEALSAFEKSASLGVRLDWVFQQVRVGFAFVDQALVRKSLAKAGAMMANKGADWERRNRLKVYEGFECLITRDFATAADTFRDAVATFGASEMCTYEEFVAYAVIASLPHLSRADIKKKLLSNADILGLERAAGADDLRTSLRLARTLVNCEYDDFFSALHAVCHVALRHPWFGPHVQYLYRELRVKGFSQYLSAYENVTLTQMAAAFGVSAAVVDAQLASFIAARRLDAMVDEVDGVVMMQRPDKRTELLQETLKQSDHLLAKIQKLARVVEA